MKMHLNGGRAEGGQVRLVEEDVLVRDDLDARVVQVEPCGNLPVGHNEDLPDLVVSSTERVSKSTNTSKEMT